MREAVYGSTQSEDIFPVAPPNEVTSTINRELKHKLEAYSEGLVTSHIHGLALPVEVGFWPMNITGTMPELAYYRVGDLTYVKEEVASFMPRSVVNRLDIITLRRMGDINYLVNRRFNATTLAAIQSTDFTNARVVDLGAGNGTSTFAALRNGASHVMAVEMDKRAVYDLAINLKFQPGNKDPSHQVKQLHTRFKPRFRLPFRPSELESKLLNANITHVIANIGPHYSGTADQEAIELLKFMPDVSTFVGGGYMLENDHPLSATHALASLERFGFELSEQFTMPTDDKTSHRMAFVARRR